jgi:hypothetical protein
MKDQIIFPQDDIVLLKNEIEMVQEYFGNEKYLISLVNE